MRMFGESDDDLFVFRGEEARSSESGAEASAIKQIVVLVRVHGRMKDAFTSCYVKTAFIPYSVDTPRTFSSGTASFLI